jgi:hypothetical protein
VERTGSVRFDRESWRRLFRQEPLDQRGWPLITRAIRDHLIRYPEELDGYLLSVGGHLGDTVPDDVARSNSELRPIVIDALCKALGAHPHERELVGQALGTLMGDRYLVSDDTGRVSIRNFEAAQKSKEARKKAKQRAKKKVKPPGDTGGTQRGQTGDTTGGQTGDPRARGGAYAGARTGAHAGRRDETRQDETTTGSSSQQTGDTKVTCPVPLPLTDEFLLRLEVDVGIPKPVAIANLTAWARQQESDPGDRRPVATWLKCARAAVLAKWSDGSKRTEMRRLANPTPEPRQEAPTKVRTYDDVQRDEAAAERARRAQA